jgi:hypothetical protein
MQEVRHGQGYLIGKDEARQLERGGMVLFEVAGVSFHSNTLQRPEFDPGRPVVLVPAPENPQDAQAIGVWAQDRSCQVGHVPRLLTERVHRLLEAGAVSSLCVWEWRIDEERVSLRVLVSPRPLRAVEEPDWGSRTLVVD